jgi:hypothetical protein
MYKTLHSKLKVKQHIPYLLKTGDEIGYSRLLLDIAYNITAGLVLCDRLRFSHMSRHHFIVFGLTRLGIEYMQHWCLSQMLYINMRQRQRSLGFLD